MSNITADIIKWIRYLVGISKPPFSNLITDDEITFIYNMWYETLKSCHTDTIELNAYVLYYTVMNLLDMISFDPAVWNKYSVVGSVKEKTLNLSRETNNSKDNSPFKARLKKYLMYPYYIDTYFYHRHINIAHIMGVKTLENRSIHRDRSITGNGYKLTGFFDRLRYGYRNHVGDLGYLYGI